MPPSIVIRWVRTEECTNPFLERTELARGKRVRLANDRDNVDTWREPTHQLDVNLPKAAWL